MSRKLFFSAKNLDWDDGSAIDAFAKEVWAASVQEFTKDPKTEHAIDETGSEHEGATDV
jgi:hypothetical protein